MKIGLLIYGSLETISGGYFYDRMLVDYLRANGECVEIISLPWRNYPAHLLDNLFFRIRSLDLDILIQDELNHPSLLAANTGKHNYPIISLVHHLRCSEDHPAWLNFIYKQIERSYLQSVDGFIFNSATTRSAVSELVESAQEGVVAYPPTDRFGFTILDEVVKLRASEPGPLRLVFLGNLIERKGLHTLLEAITLMPQAFHLDVIGSSSADPAYARAMQQKVEMNGLKARVQFHGALENQKLAEKLKSAHILVVPSSYEGYGIVYMEGMGFGLPAIGGSTGAAGEVIDHGKTGFLVKSGDTKGLFLHLKQLADDRELLLNLSLNALARYKTQPAWQQTAENIRQFLYRKVSEHH